jgi:hypothetical protein
MTLLPGATEELPLRVAVFAPGTFVLGDYLVSWEPVDSPLEPAPPPAAGGVTSTGLGSGAAGGSGGSWGSGGSGGSGNGVGPAVVSLHQLLEERRTVRPPSQACNSPFLLAVDRASS